MIHKLADVRTKNIGSDTQVWQYAVIIDGATIGNNCNINCHTFIESDVVIGNNVTVKSGVYLWNGLIVEDNVFIGPNVTFTNDLAPRSKQPPEEFVKTIIKKGVSIGANATVIAGISIGEHAMIGAGSVVTKNIHPFTLWYGNPAVQNGYVTKDGILLTMDLIDKNNKNYTLINGEPIISE